MLIEREQSYSSALSCWLGGEQCGRGWELSWSLALMGCPSMQKGQRHPWRGDGVMSVGCDITALTWLGLKILFRT